MTPEEIQKIIDENNETLQKIKMRVIVGCTAENMHWITSAIQNLGIRTRYIAFEKEDTILHE